MKVLPDSCDEKGASGQSCEDLKGKENTRYKETAEASFKKIDIVKC